MNKPIITATAMLILLIAGGTRADTYLVKPDGTGDFPVIQAAIDGAMDGDVILLADGTFTGMGNIEVLFWGKKITIRSQNGKPQDCIIDAEGSAGTPRTPFVFEHGEGAESRIMDLTILNGSTSTSC